MTNQTQSLVSKDEALQAMQDYVKAKSTIEKIEAEERMEINVIQAKHNERKADPELRMKEAEAKVRTFAEHHRDELLAEGSKSTVFGTGKIGWRRKPAKLGLAASATWDNVLATLEKKLPQFVRTKKEINKKELLKEAQQMKPKELEKLGVEVRQEEDFFISL